MPLTSFIGRLMENFRYFLHLSKLHLNYACALQSDMIEQVFMVVLLVQLSSFSELAVILKCVFLSNVRTTLLLH